MSAEEEVIEVTIDMAELKKMKVNIRNVSFLLTLQLVRVATGT